MALFDSWLCLHFAMAARVSSRKNVWGGSSGKCRAKCFEVN